jgi:hypothetical protein
MPRIGGNDLAFGIAQIDAGRLRTGVKEGARGFFGVVIQALEFGGGGRVNLA